MTSNLLLDGEMAAAAPACWNREPPESRVRTRYGIDQETGEVRAFEVDDGWSDPGCRTWEGTGIGSNNERYPEAHGWVEWCRSCRRRPAGVGL